MNLKAILAATGLLAGTTLAVPHQAQAAPTLFDFDTHISYPGTPHPCVANVASPICDIKLDSVTIQGKTLGVDQLSKVTAAALIQNKIIPARSTSSTAGGVSVDRGDQANGPVQNDLPAETDGNAAKFNTSAAEHLIVEALGKDQPIFNMNNILDTEDQGFFTLDVLFGSSKQLLNSVLLWERGMNSKLKVQAITAVSGNQATGFGDVITVDSVFWPKAGYDINTTEIPSAQPVGAKGIRFSSNILGVRLISEEKGFNGPDFKLSATKVPEPATVASLGMVAGAAWALRRRRQSA
jgi:hypothetical protein